MVVKQRSEAADAFVTISISFIVMVSLNVPPVSQPDTTTVTAT
jgi:hypothetical protein